MRQAFSLMVTRSVSLMRPRWSSSAATCEVISLVRLAGGRRVLPWWSTSTLPLAASISTQDLAASCGGGGTMSALQAVDAINRLKSNTSRWGKYGGLLGLSLRGGTGID